jgi:acyl-CoA thioesterase YciA
MQFKTRKLVKPGDLNPRGTLFGGRLLEWIDEEAAIYAMCQLDTTNIVTKFVSEIDFKKPAYQGDVVEIGVEVIKFGRTSITVKAVAQHKGDKMPILTINQMTFVHVDSTGYPTPHFKTTEK